VDIRFVSWAPLPSFGASVFVLASASNAFALALAFCFSSAEMKGSFFSSKAFLTFWMFFVLSKRLIHE